MKRLRVWSYGAKKRTFLMRQNLTFLKSSDIETVDNLSYVKL